MPMNVILADDHVMIRDGLKPFIERIGQDVSVLEAGSFPDVMAHMKANSIDLVILDLKMPGMNGFQGLTVLRQTYPKVRCVMLSASTDREHVMESIRLGADGFIPKHMSGAAMVSALQLVLSGERFVPSTLMDHKSDANRDHQDENTSKLTPRERDILRLLSEGLPNKIIAARLDVSEVTVKSHLGNIFRKLGVQNRLQAMRLLLDRDIL